MEADNGALTTRAPKRRPLQTSMGTLTRWHVGPLGQPGPNEGVVAFTAGELDNSPSRAAATVGLHEAMTGSLPAAGQVDIRVPAYRGNSLIPVLAWLAATHLSERDARVSWFLEKRQGPDSVRRLLEGLGWALDKDRVGRAVRLSGAPPATASLPAPRSYEAQLGDRRVELLADYGVFSPSRVDEGTALLLGVALQHRPIDVVADVGVGYGPLAIGLILNAVARSAVATDVDCIALWLAQRNAQAQGVQMALECTPDPTAVPPTPLTVCNVPTHINAEETRRFMAALARRAEHGTLLAVVHASLEARYTQHLNAAGLRVNRHPGPNHVVLETTHVHR